MPEVNNANFRLRSFTILRRLKKKAAPGGAASMQEGTE